MALALHADGTLAYGLPGLEPGGGDEESMEDDSALESDDDGTGVLLPHDEDGDDDDDDDDVVIVYERLVQGWKDPGSNLSQIQFKSVTSLSVLIFVAC